MAGISARGEGVPSPGRAYFAEGVETEQQRNLLLAEGCDQAQGYLYGRPVAAEKSEKLLFSDGIEGGDRTRFNYS